MEVLWQAFGMFQCRSNRCCDVEAARANCFCSLSARKCQINPHFFQPNVPVAEQDTVVFRQPGGAEHRLGSILEEWGIDRAQLEDIPILWLPSSVVFLAKNQQWTSVLVPLQYAVRAAVSWMQCALSWPAQGTLGRLYQDIKRFAPQAVAPLNSEAVNFLIRVLTSCQDHIIQEAHEPEEVKMQLEQALEGLCVHQQCLQGGANSASNGPESGKGFSHG